MTLEEFAYLAEIVGVILVIASLVYVAKQLRQNTDALHVQSRQAVLTAAQTEIFAITENPDIIVLMSKPDALSPEEHVKVASWLFALFRARQFAWLQHRNGVIDDSQWETELSVIRFYFDSQRVQDWWNALGRAAFGNEYANFIDSLVRDQSPTETLVPAFSGWTPT
jgi:hypothetical protein